VALAIEHADARGIEQLSMRKLAAELAVTPMALYWHFANRDALLDAMAERVAGQLVYDDNAGAPWQERLRAVLSATLSVFRDHPWLGPLARHRIVPAPNYLRALEVLLDAVRTAGYGPKAAVYVVDFAIDSLAAMATEFADAPTQGSKAPPASETQLEMRRQLLDLTGTEYPRIREAAVPLTTSEAPAAYVKLGIDILVAGIESAAPKKRGRKGQHRAAAREK
jgi:TetR/AcrR family transcriptional regulator, tetracycline repressor protein